MHKPSILLIDDAAMMRRFITLFLSDKYQVTECKSAEEALELVENGLRPRLVVADLDLPGMSGLDLIRHFQLNMPFTPLIAICEKNTGKSRSEALAAGASDFLFKPFHLAELAVRIGKILRRGETPQLSIRSSSELISAFRRFAAAIIS